MNLFTAIMICSVFHTNSITNAIIMTGSNANPLAITPRGAPTRTNFKTAAEAAAFAQQQIDAGTEVEIGMMQISSVWLDKLAKRGIRLQDLLRSCQNLAVGSDLLNEAEAYCATKTDSIDEREDCALSFYKTSSPTDGLSFAQSIQDYAKKHPIKSNPINHQIDFDGWQLDPGQQLPTPAFGESEPTPDTQDSEDADIGTDTNES